MRLLSIITLCLAALTAGAAEPVPADTVITITKPTKVTVTNKGKNTEVTVRGRKGDPNYNYSYTVSEDKDYGTTPGMPQISLPFSADSPNRIRRARAHSEIKFVADITAGMILPGHTPEGLGYGWETSIGRLASYCYTPARSKATLSVGVGFMYRQWYMKDGFTLATEADALRIIGPVEGHTDTHATLRSSSILVPLTYTQRLGGSFGFSISVAANLNVCMRGSSAYTVGDVRYSTKIEGLHQRMLTPDFMFTIGSVGTFGVYARWSPVRVFKGMYGPQFSNTTIGINIGF